MKNKKHNTICSGCHKGLNHYTAYRPNIWEWTADSYYCKECLVDFFSHKSWDKHFFTTNEVQTVDINSLECINDVGNQSFHVRSAS